MRKLRIGMGLVLLGLISYGAMWALGKWWTPKEEGIAIVWAWASGVAVGLFCIGFVLLISRLRWFWTLGIPLLIAGLMLWPLKAVAVDALRGPFMAGYIACLIGSGVLVLGIPLLIRVVFPLAAYYRGKRKK